MLKMYVTTQVERWLESYNKAPELGLKFNTNVIIFVKSNSVVLVLYLD